jgi:hypothetical protein
MRAGVDLFATAVRATSDDGLRIAEPAELRTVDIQRRLLRSRSSLHRAP